VAAGTGWEYILALQSIEIASSADGFFVLIPISPGLLACIADQLWTHLCILLGGKQRGRGNHKVPSVVVAAARGLSYPLNG
jgi:hypothetical protein